MIIKLGLHTPDLVFKNGYSVFLLISAWFSTNYLLRCISTNYDWRSELYYANLMFLGKMLLLFTM